MKKDFFQIFLKFFEILNFCQSLIKRIIFQLIFSFLVNKEFADEEMCLLFGFRTAFYNQLNH